MANTAGLDRAMILGISALALYVAGGIFAFSGLLLAFKLGEANLWGWGDGKSIGYLFLALGMGMSMGGVLMMRIFRNRC
jgi:hypothetical protein